MSKTTSTACPKCHKPVTFVAHPEKPGRLIANCTCNPAGPVIETDAPNKTESATELVTAVSEEPGAKKKTATANGSPVTRS